MTALERYFRSLSEIHNTGSATKETSYYGPLETLLNELGQQLKPKVRCVMQLKQQGAGMPDGGLFSARQFQRSGDLKDPTNPERGVIEVKGTGESVSTIAQSQQVSKYWQRYGQVLVTNYRDFVLVGRDAVGQPVTLESFSLAASEQVFWQKAQDAKAFAAEQEEQLSEYLKRVMLHQAVITSPQVLAWFLASYAKDARARIDKTDLPNLAQVREALEEALGVGFQGDKGDRFFKSTLIQTLFYGIFSAWVLWHRQAGQGRFSWREAVWYMHVPMIQALFSKVATPMNLGPLDLVEVLDWAGEALNRVDGEAFFTEFEEAQAVQYFYEPFLQAFDPQLRKDLGVWYTPPEIVQYMVARVDTVLREELGIDDGLADPSVYILDPCCGTGAFLVEVLRKIDETLKANGADALSGSDLKQAAMERVFGFEILTAPFVVAHLQLGLLLQNLGVPLVDEQERMGVFLTNALTGWEPSDEEGKQRIQQLGFSFPELKQERDAAEQIKHNKKILVVLGNPPYNAYAGISPKEEKGLVEPYKKGLISEWGIKKFNLDELYVRFFRIAERCIVENKYKKGVVCFISNYSWLRERSFVVLRQHLLNSFNRFWIENMHGDRNITEYAPDGKTSETIFSMKGFSPGIKQGVAISLWAKLGKTDGGSQILFRDNIDMAKASDRRANLLGTLEEADFELQYKIANPVRENYLSFRPGEVCSHYLEWPKIDELCADQPINGLFEKRGNALIDIDKQSLKIRIEMYFNPGIDWVDLAKLGTGLTKDVARFDAKKARVKVCSMEKFSESRIHRYAVRPFDTRWCYYTSVRPLWNEPRPALYKQLWEGNTFLLTRPSGVASPEGPPVYFTRSLGDNDFLRGHAYYFPCQLRSGNIENTTQTAEQISIAGIVYENKITANLSPAARTYMSELGIEDPDNDVETARLIWMHVLAISYSSSYLEDNADGVQQNWPRIPFPKHRQHLITSANLGKQIAALLDTETSIPGITSGNPRDDLKTIAPSTRVGGGQLNPDTDLALTANWGYTRSSGITMPGKGRVVTRPYTAAETVGWASPTTPADALVDGGQCPPYQELLGADTRDIYLNDIAYWQNIPARVWDYTIGGYPVIKKWLSYREAPLLGRPLKPDEVREVTNMARRIAAILLLEPALNANYEAVKADTYNWPASNK